MVPPVINQYFTSITYIIAVNYLIKPINSLTPMSPFFVLSKYRKFPFYQYVIRHGLGVRIAGSHPAGPGSIPGVGILF